MIEPSYDLMFFFRSVLFLLLIFNLSAGYAQHPNVSQVKDPSWIQKSEPNFEANLSEDRATGFYYLLADKQEHLGLDQSYRRFTYKILNSSGVQDMSDLSIDFDPAYQKISIHHINVIREGRIIDKYDPLNIQIVQRETNMERKLYDGRLTFILNLTDIRVGDIVDYSYTITGSNPVYKGKFQANFSLQFNIEAHHNRISIIVPKDEEVHFQKLYGAKDPEIEKLGEITRYTWESIDLKKIDYESNTPSWYDETPSVDISQFNSWGEVAGLFVNSYTLGEKERDLLRSRVKELFPNSEDDKEFIEIAIRFVQDEVRYLGFESGTNSHIPSNPFDVLQRRYGDCKDKSFLLSEILQSQGIEAYPMLVHSFNGRNITAGLPSPNAFDHCVVQINLGTQGTKYIDPTISEQGGDLFKMYFPDYKNGLVLRPGTSLLTSLPYPEKSTTNITETFELDDVGGGANFIVETIYRGDAADTKRRGFMESSLQSIHSDYTTFYSSLYPGIKAEGKMSFEDDREKNEFVVFERYRIDSIWTKTGGTRDIINAEFYPLSMEDFLFPENSGDRKMPYYLDQDLDVIHKTVVYVPEAWNVTNNKRSVKSAYFTWDLDIKYNNAKLEITHHYKTLKDHVAAADVKEFLADHSKIQEDLIYTLTYNNEVAGADAANSTSWAAVIFMLFCIIGAGTLCYVIYRNYDIPNKVDARHERKIGGWLILLAIGLIFSPIVIINQLLSGNYFSSSIWISWFSSPDTVTLALLLGTELIFYSVLLVFSVLVLVLFFKRRTIAPRMMMILYGGNLLFSAILAFATIGLHPEFFGGPERQKIYLELGKMGIRCLIFIPYLLYSTRVEETFTRTRNKHKEEPEENFTEELPILM